MKCCALLLFLTVSLPIPSLFCMDIAMEKTKDVLIGLAKNQTIQTFVGVTALQYTESFLTNFCIESFENDTKKDFCTKTRDCLKKSFTLSPWPLICGLYSTFEARRSFELGTKYKWPILCIRRVQPYTFIEIMKDKLLKKTIHFLGFVGGRYILSTKIPNNMVYDDEDNDGPEELTPEELYARKKAKGTLWGGYLSYVIQLFAMETPQRIHLDIKSA